MSTPDKPQSQIYALMSKVMADIGAITKDQYNKQQNYNFRGIDDVYNALQPALVKHGIFCTPRLQAMRTEYREGKNKNGQPQTIVISEVEMTYIFFASDGSSVAATTPGVGMDYGGDKAVYKAMSGAYKYALFQTFVIPTEEVKDAESDSPKIEPAHKEDPAKSASAHEELWGERIKTAYDYIEKADSLDKMTELASWVQRQNFPDMDDGLIFEAYTKKKDELERAEATKKEQGK